MVNIRMKEHQRDVRLKQHYQNITSRQTIKYFDKTTTIATTTSYFTRQCREAIEIQKYPDNLNRDNGIIII